MARLIELTEMFDEEMNQHLGVLEISSLRGWSSLDFEELSDMSDLVCLYTAVHNLQTHVGSSGHFVK